MHRVLKKFKKAALFLAKPQIVFFVLLWLIVLLVAGTVAQKYVGLYQAQNLFFVSWLVWWGPVSLPGGMPTLGLLTLSLAAKLFFASQWNWRNSGVIITHIGAMLLLLGGLLTYLHAREGSMTIYEGDSANFISDYHVRELVVEDDETKEVIASFPWSALEKGKALNIPGVPFHVEIVNLCRNCDVFPRQVPEEDPSLAEFRGMARRMGIKTIPLAKDDEQNRGAIQFRISGAEDEEKNGIHFSTDFIDKCPQVEAGDHIYNIALRKQRTYLPFSIELVDFEKTYYPGTDMPKSYKSEVVLHENGSEWRSLIQMNEPLRYRGYTFYQSSFIDANGTEATILAVVRNAGRMFPYIASILMCVGLLMHVFLNIPRLIRGRDEKKTAAAKALVLACLLGGLGFHAAPAQAAKGFDYTNLTELPILDHGRVKPLDTFARSYLEIIYGRDAMPDMSAMEWLVELVMDPDRGYKREIFNIYNPAIVDALELERREGHKYSYQEITVAFYHHAKTWHALFTQPEEELSFHQKQLLELFNKTQIFADLSRSLSLLFPEFSISEGPVAETLGVDPGTTLSYFQIAGFQDALTRIAEDYAKKKEGKNYKISAEDMAFEQLMGRLDEISRDRNASLFKVIPPQWSEGRDAHTEMWFSPWDIGVYGQGSPNSVKFLNMWAELLVAYRSRDYTAWSVTSYGLKAFSQEMVSSETLDRAMSLEVTFNAIDPFMISFALYFSALLAAMVSFMLWPERLRQLGFALLFSGFVIHLAGLGVRMFIMQRPPVTNLYESVIFVALVSVLFGLILEWRLKNALGILTAATMGSLLHFVGMKFNAEGDTMGMLVAVLDTNFWLATHVVTVTTGYGCALVAAVLGHIYLLTAILRPGDRKGLEQLHRNMRGVVFVALLFASIGTILGGIWADQSWGRFWGWDPKENGALLIVLWLVSLIHGRLSRILGDLEFAVGMVCTNIVVATAWFGVNLLGVGLHSYGFTETAAMGFVVFCSFELTFAALTYALLKVRQKKMMAAA